MQDIIDELGSKEQVRELIDYYFGISRGDHELSWFFFNYDKLGRAYRLQVKDRAKRRQLMEETKRRMEDNA
jgi:hypothetical protein